MSAVHTASTYKLKHHRPVYSPLLTLHCSRCQSGLEARPSGHIGILSREHFSASGRAEHITPVHPLRCPSNHPVLSSDICCLGQFVLVFEFSCQSYCALLATLVHQWTRRYVRNTQTATVQSRESARETRAFFSEGAEKLYLSRVVETLPTLVHLSLFLFFIGLLIFLSIPIAWSSTL